MRQDVLRTWLKRYSLRDPGPMFVICVKIMDCVERWSQESKATISQLVQDASIRAALIKRFVT